MIHELHVHQAELEAQNEALRTAQVEIEISRSRYLDLYDFAPIGYITLDQKGMILEANLAAAELLDVVRSELPSWPFIRFVSSQSRNTFHHHLERVFSTGTSEVCDIELIKKNGKSFYVSLKSACSKDNEGHSIQCRSAIFDITERKKRTVEELQKAHAELLETSKVAERARKYAESIVETIREPLLVLSPDLRVISANRTFYETFKVQPGETVGEYLYDLGNRQWDIPRLRHLLEDILPKNATFDNFEVDHQFQTIGQKTMLLNARRIYGEGERTQTILLAIEDITFRKQAENALRESENRLRFLSTELLRAQETERKRIASDLHDSLGASLGVIKFKIGNVQQKGHNGEAVEEEMATLAKLVEECAQDVRRIQMDLRPPMLDDLGILPALSWFSRRFQTTYPKINVECQFDMQDSAVPGVLGTVIFRITQESLNNVAKHTTATLVKLSLRKIDARMELTIQDNGQGFDKDAVLSRESSKRGLGLTSMRERTELSGGFFSVESSKEKGTIIKATWPTE